MACVAPEGINDTAWGAKLILTADLAYPVSCAGLDGTALLFVFECLLYPCYDSTPTPYRLDP